MRALAEPALRERGAIGLIAGDAVAGRRGPRGAPCVELAASLGVADRVRLVGFRDDVETVYGAADVVAVPSTEPDPLPGRRSRPRRPAARWSPAPTAGCRRSCATATPAGWSRPATPARSPAPRPSCSTTPRARERLGAAAGADVREPVRASATELLDVDPVALRLELLA